MIEVPDSVIHLAAELAAHDPTEFYATNVQRQLLSGRVWSFTPGDSP